MNKQTVDNPIGSDGSEYFKWLELTQLGEPICINEYATRIAQVGSSIHVIQLDDFQADMAVRLKEEHINFYVKFYEMVLSKRDGRDRFTFCNDCALDNIEAQLRQRRKEQKVHVIQMPYHLHYTAGADYRKWHELKEPEQVIFDLRKVN